MGIVFKWTLMLKFFFDLDIVEPIHVGEFMGIPPTGKKVEVGGIAINRIENGKIVEDWEEADVLGWMTQIGMELKPKEGE